MKTLFPDKGDNNTFPPLFPVPGLRKGRWRTASEGFPLTKAGQGCFNNIHIFHFLNQESGK